MDRFSERSVIHLQGSTPRPKVQGGARFTSGGTRGAHEGKHNRVLPESACSKGRRARGSGSGSRSANSQARNTSSGNVRRKSAGQSCASLRWKQRRAWPRKTMPRQAHRPGNGKAGNDRNAFRSTMEQARRPRETAVDTGGGRTSTVVRSVPVQCPRNGGRFGRRLQPRRRGQISFERACHRGDIKA